jgi:hypothetical protein
METQIYLTKGFDLHKRRLWLLTDRRISELYAVPLMYLKHELQIKESCGIYRDGYIFNWYFYFPNTRYHSLRRIT